MNIKTIRMIGVLILALCLVFVSCEGPDQPVYDADNPDPNPTGGEAATVSSVEPASDFFAATVKVKGTGFNTDPDNNVVNFGNRVGTVTEASATELTVILPGIIGETVDTRVAVSGSEFWSNKVDFEFKALPESHELTTIDEEINWPNGVAIDADDNVYIGSAGDGVIFKITPTGEKSEFATVAVNGHIHFGPSGYLYVCAKDEGKIVRISPDGATIEDVVELENVVDFDWDENGDMYLLGNDAGVFKFADGSVTQLAEIGSSKNLRVFDGGLYVSDIWEGTIWRFDITADGLENQEAVYEGDSPSSFDLAANGLMIFAEAWDISLFTMFSDGSLGPAMYEEEMETPMRYMVWHKKSIYVVYPGWGEVGKTLKAYIGLEQAPRYGKQ
jgi:hypothetical protein